MAARVGASTSFYMEGIVNMARAPPPPSHGCLLSLGLELLPVCADKALALLPLRNLLPPLPWHFIINPKYHSLRRITFCVCQVFSVLFHLLSLFIPFVLPYRPLHTRLNENLCLGMKTVVLVFDFLVCVLSVVIHINRAS